MTPTTVKRRLEKMLADGWILKNALYQLALELEPKPKKRQSKTKRAMRDLGLRSNGMKCLEDMGCFDD